MYLGFPSPLEENDWGVCLIVDLPKVMSAVGRSDRESLTKPNAKFPRSCVPGLHPVFQARIVALMDR
jgi:hypothetical protein